jgi:NAD dependent epimerase/dehydratase family enzyme
MFGGIADDALLASLRVVPKKLLDTGFVFDHSELVPALRLLLGRLTNAERGTRNAE